MNNDIGIDLILNRKNYGHIYKINCLLILILLIFAYVIFTYKYQSYYISKGKVIDCKLELMIDNDDIKYFENTNYLYIDNDRYNYRIDYISSLYVDEDYHNYVYIYLNIINMICTDNYVYEIKIPNENKLLAEHLKDYLLGGINGIK